MESECLEATTVTSVIGLEGPRLDMTDYNESMKLIEAHMTQFQATRLEKMDA